MSSPVMAVKPVRFNRGYFPAQDAVDSFPNTAIDGRGVWKFGETLVSDKGTTSVQSGTAANPLMIAGGATAGMSGGIGNVLYHLTVYWFAGSGNAIVAGSSIGTSTGKLMLKVGSTVYEAGLTKPAAAPTVAVSATASGIMAGAYALSYAKLRSTTGAVSSRSPISLPVAANKFKINITLPAASAEGEDFFLLYGTRRNFAGLGLVFRITTIAPIAATGSPQTIAVEWQDGDLGEAAPLTNDKAPTCTHCAALGGVMCAITVGGMVYPSKAGLPEAYDYGLAVRLASGEAPTGVIPQGSEGGQFVCTLNSISLLVLSGAPEIPVIPRGVFAQTGVAHGNAICWAKDQLYGMSSKGMPFRSHGSEAPDSTFALPVLKEMRSRGFTGANTTVVEDEINGAILYCSGTAVFPYMIDTGEWSAPIVAPGTVTAGIDSKIAVGGTLYTMNTGSAPPSECFLLSPRENVGNAILTLESFRSAGKTGNNCTLDVYNAADTSVGGYFPLAFTSPNGSPENLQPNIKSRSFAVRWSTSTAGRTPPVSYLTISVEPGNH